LHYLRLYSLMDIDGYISWNICVFCFYGVGVIKYICYHISDISTFIDIQNKNIRQREREREKEITKEIKVHVYIIYNSVL